MLQPTLEIILKQTDKTYNVGDLVCGIVVVDTKSSKLLNHQGLTLNMSGVVTMELSKSSVGRFEALYNSLKPIDIVGYSVELAPDGKFPPGRTEIPFEFPLRPKKNQELYETYHGYYVSVKYGLEADLKRGLMSKSLGKRVEFIVQVPSKPRATKDQFYKEDITFELSPESVQATGVNALPELKIVGQIDRNVFEVGQPLTGSIKVVSSKLRIRSMELQLLRVETCGCAEGFSKDESEIQNIQFVDGDVLRDYEIPLLMVFPRLFTCPTTSGKSFKLEFEINIVVVFQDNRLIKQNFPIEIVRSPTGKK